MSKRQKFSLNIHHRSIKLSNHSVIHPNKGLLAGHFYIGLERNGKEIFLNKYPKTIGFLDNLVDAKEIKMELAAVYGSIQTIEGQPLTQSITTQIIPLTAEQFAKAYTYAVARLESKEEKPYLILSGNAEYVQSVYHAAGLPLYFTTIYTQNELTNLHTHAAKYVLLKYGSRDTLVRHLRSVASPNQEELSEQLNIKKEAIHPVLIPAKESKYGFFSVSLKDIILPDKSVVPTTSKQESLIGQLKGVFEISLPYPVPHQFFLPQKKWCDIIPIPLFYMNSKVISSGPAIMQSDPISYWQEKEKTYEAELYLNYTKFHEFIKVDEIASRVSTDIAKFLEKFWDLLVVWDFLSQHSGETEKKEKVTFLTKLKKHFTKKAVVLEVSPEELLKIEKRQIEQMQVYNKVIQEINERFNQVADEATEKFDFLELITQGRLPDYLASLFNINSLTTAFLKGVINDLEEPDGVILLG